MRPTMLVLVISLACFSCAAPSISHVQERPLLQEFPRESVIIPSDSLRVSGVVSTPQCDILLSEASRGHVLRVRPNGVLDGLGAPDDVYRGAQLAEYTDDTSLMWSRSGSTVGLIDHESLEVRKLTIPSSDWGLPIIGSVEGVLESWIAIAYLADGPPVPQPEPWPTRASLVRLVGPRGASVATLGTLERQPGRYLSWLLARSVLGSHGRRISALFLSQGRVTTFALSEEGLETDRSEYSLPIYIASPHPREELWTPEWIQIGGDVAHLIEVSQVIAADFKSDGGAVAIRPYMAEWRRVRNPFGPTQGVWEITDKGLEVYSADGALEQAFALPSPTIGRVAVDRHDRLYLFDQDGSVFVSSVLMGSGDRVCPTLPSFIEIEVPSQ